MTSEKKDGIAEVESSRRRRVLKAGAALTGAFALGVPMIGRGQAEKIKIGHLTPLTGFLGALGEYSVMGIKIATDEINASGGVHGTADRGDQRGLGQPAGRLDQGAAHDRARRRRGADGRDQLGLRAHDLAGRRAQQEAVHEHRRALRRAARQELQPLHVPRRHPGHRDGERGRPGAAARQPGQGQAGLQPDRRLPVRARPREGGQEFLHGERRRPRSATSWSRPTSPTFPPTCSRSGRRSPTSCRPTSPATR